MSDYTLQVSKDARIEISAIKRYIKYKLKNVQAADNFYEDTRKAFEHILENPYAHQVKDSSEEIDGFPKRQFQYRNNYILYYVVLEDRNIIRIVKVAYSWMDLSKV